ncbi:hypothetical protein AMTRI_Chr03g52760 [Amborella trichopoda]|uniref:KOW domain-containing protein n=1 Tax=Amborella trichopoda TaxID=13333 RepID=W1P0R3_AMBTC|nr:50S ribosomal protein L19-1, chloroplastic [Amborella trichopoda]ERN01141.1 hypothetical protein AMTR_s00002p00210720 [Amborella trichopoda]|eukprot:XP_006838572.1 50S ribosomal protein L19-1, chloroplastic [Amborella trichopoda]
MAPLDVLMASKLNLQVNGSVLRNRVPYPFISCSLSSSSRVKLSPMNSASKTSTLMWGLGKRMAVRPVVVEKRFLVKAQSENEEGELGSEENVSENAESALEAETSSLVVATLEAPEPEVKPRKRRIKFGGEIMEILNKRAVEASEKERPVPDIRTGDIVEIKLEVPDNKRRVAICKGIVISRQNAGIHTTIRIRRIIAGVGVEIVFPLYSPNIKEIKVVSHRKVRRARLYYLRYKLPRLSTFK